MTGELRSLVALICLYLAACAGIERASDNRYDEGAADRQVLVMLRMPPPHFRPDASYAPSYGPGIGQDARDRIARALASQYGLRIVESWPMPALGVDCFVMQAADGAALVQVVKALTADPRVESAQQINLFNVLAYNDPLYPVQPSAAQWHLADLHRITTGKRVRIAEIDTGVELDHPDLVGQIPQSRNFVDQRAAVAEAHGTAVAGIIAARADNGVGIAGVAPEASLFALRACWEKPGRDGRATCSSFTLAKALQFALDQDAAVINLSIGGPRDRLLERLLDAALARDIAVVAAYDPSGADGAFPASHRGVLAIARDAVQDSAAEVLAAPGRDIPTTLPGRRWGIVSGSSFAAAHVTGLVALLREIKPGLQPAQLRALLAPEALSSLATDHSIIVDACMAVARTAGTCACACTSSRRAQLQVP